jgi:two-component system, NtrC family, nitrogen regulation sensor histidine kinase NtrY
MAFDKFYTAISFRVIGVAVSAGIFVFALHRHQWYVTSLVAGIAVILMALELVRFAGRSRNQLALLLTMLRQKDFSSRWKEEVTAEKPQLNLALSNIINEFENVRIEKEVQNNYLQIIIEHISIALICYDEHGNIKLFNKAARNMFRISSLTKLISLDSIDPDFPGHLINMDAGSHKLYKLLIAGELHQLLIKCTGVRLQDKSLKLISLQDIRPELESKETESWQKIIRILTHEIMNSVTPVSSLSEALNAMLNTEDVPRNLAALEDAEVQHLYAGLRSIENRSKGLIRFLGSYKKLSRLSAPVRREVKISELLQGIISLLKPSLNKSGKKIILNISDPTLTIFADVHQIEQVLINLVKNSEEAIGKEHRGIIKLHGARSVEGRVLIQVIDNGPGVNSEITDEIFIPFFTTKKGGSGIGLSLSRQIMRLHGGRIFIQSGTGGETVFTMEF